MALGLLKVITTEDSALPLRSLRLRGYCFSSAPKNRRDRRGSAENQLMS
jgi:hypothetical protein